LDRTVDEFFLEDFLLHHQRRDVDKVFGRLEEAGLELLELAAFPLFVVGVDPFLHLGPSHREVVLVGSLGFEVVERLQTDLALIVLLVLPFGRDRVVHLLRLLLLEHTVLLLLLQERKTLSGTGVLEGS